MTTGTSLIFVLVCMLTKNVDGENKNVVKEIRNSLALEILASSAKSAKNTVVATLPLQFMLCKLASVATGKVKEELLKALGFSNDTMIDTFYIQFRMYLFPSYMTDLTYINKIYADVWELDAKLSNNLTIPYGVHVDKVNYKTPRSAANYINSQIATTTYRRVENILDSHEISNLTSLLLITAGHYKPSWSESFNPDLTRDRSFKLLNNTMVDISMMAKVERYDFYNGQDFKVLTYRLKLDRFSMTFILPAFLSIDQVLNKLAKAPDTIKNIREEMTPTELRLWVPKMKIKSQIDLDSFLQDSGIKEIFDKESTGLNAMRKEGSSSNIFVSKVRQKLFIEVDEFGVSRYKKAQKDEGLVPASIREFVLDRPFYFKISVELPRFHKQDLLPLTDPHDLFSAVYYGPE